VPGKLLNAMEIPFDEGVTEVGELLYDSKSRERENKTKGNMDSIGMLKKRNQQKKSEQWKLYFVKTGIG